MPKISAYAEDAAPTTDDLIVTVTDPAGTPVTKKVTLANLKKTLANALINDQTGTTYTLLASDNGKVVTCSNASPIDVTVPSGLGAGFNCLVVQKGAGVVSFVEDSTTIENRQGFVDTAGQWAVASLVAIASDLFVLGGDLA